MSNALSPFANATLVWQVAVSPVVRRARPSLLPPPSGMAPSGYTEDTTTGNYVASLSGVTYYATLKQKQNPRFDYLLGADATAVYMEGRLTSPLALSNISPGSSAAATINGREGRFELLPNEQIAEHYWQFLGTPIRGIFRLIGKGSVQNV